MPSELSLTDGKGMPRNPAKGKGKGNHHENQNDIEL